MNEKQTVIEVTSYDDIYNFMNKDLWMKLVDTPYTSYVDLEDPDNNNFQIKRFYKHNSDWTNYVECDSRYAA